MWLVWILSAGARHFVEILPTNLLDDELSYDLDHHLGMWDDWFTDRYLRFFYFPFNNEFDIVAETEEGFTLVNAKSPVIPKLILEEPKIAPEFTEISYKSPIAIIKGIRSVVGKESFRKLLYSSLTGIQVLVRGPKAQILESLYGLSHLVPAACRRIVTHATEYMDPNLCNFIGKWAKILVRVSSIEETDSNVLNIGVDTSVAVPLPSSSICRLDIIPKEPRMESTKSHVVKWEGTLPAKLPTLLVKIEKSLDNEKLGEPVLRSHFRALQEEWAKYVNRCPRSRVNILIASSFQHSEGGSCDEGPGSQRGFVWANRQLGSRSTRS